LCQLCIVRYTVTVLIYKHTVIAASLIGIGIIGTGLIEGKVEVSANRGESVQESDLLKAVPSVDFLSAVVEKVLSAEDFVAAVEDEDGVSVADLDEISEVEVAQTSRKQGGVTVVPFYSQFNDISAPEWKKIGCGIASLAMLIEYYEPNSVTVDELLQRGIDSQAYLSDAGWTHSGLINLAHKYGLSGESHSLADSSMDDAFAVLKDELKEGPVMASVHYTFDPANPIPHLVVVNGVSDGKVYYNDPSESGGGGSISIAKFQSSWKKRYIDIRPIS